MISRSRAAFPWAVVAFAVAAVTTVAQQSPSRAIKVDQAGYRPGYPKVAFAVDEGSSGRFRLRHTSDRAIAFDGTLEAPVQDPDSGDRVRAADFSAFTASGIYVLDVPGVGVSWPFTIAEDVYHRPLWLALRSFYGQRCNTSVDLGDAFPGYAYEACHREGRFHPSSGRAGAVRPSGGWHDAGDYGRYVVNSGLSTGTLLWTWELYGDRLAPVSLEIPESGNQVPDILDEIRWNLAWMQSMQDEDGGAWHKQTSERFAGFVMPHEDHAPSVVIGTGTAPWKSTCATADLSAVLAIAARAYRPHDAGYADASLAAARRAFAWAESHPDVTFRNPTGVSTGAYGDRSCADERLWAVAELWRTTREASYHRLFVERYASFLGALRSVEPPSWPSVAPMGLWTYVLGGGPDDEVAGAIRRASVAAADAIVARTRSHAYRISLTTKDYVWGSNGVAANYGVQLLVTHALSPDVAYVRTAVENLHYLLGRNPFSLSWVSGVGANPFRHPHHRPSGADRQAAPWPGLLSGGPNARRQDPAMEKLPALPPAKMYVDDEASYASNETAINWNAPLVFLLAGAQWASP